MKKLILNLFLFGALITFFGSCSDDEKPTGGSFTWDGEKITLKKGFSADYEPYVEGEDTYYQWSMVLTSDAIEFDEEENTMVGTGDLLYFWVTGVNIGETELPVGTFNFDAGDGENELDWSGVSIDYGTQDVTWDSFTSGHVTISKNGSTYVIEFSLTTSNDETISGKFRGTFSYGYLPS